MHHLRAVITTACFTCGVLFSQQLATGRIDIDPVEPDYPALEPPRFEITLHRGRLHMAGHTVSAGHERRLTDIAAQSFSGRQADFEFLPLGTLPGHWSDSTALALAALARTQSASAVLTANSLTIRGIAGSDWPDYQVSLRSGLPDTLDLSAAIMIPDVDVDVATLCARALARHRAGPIVFDESGTRFRSSAYGVLDRIVTLLDTCRDSSISITGHSDSSGDEAWNRQLSLARASAVADYLEQHGIAPGRITVAGAGSASPVADNDTRHGRSLNRRIDIQMRPASVADSIP